MSTPPLAQPPCGASSYASSSQLTSSTNLSDDSSYVVIENQVAQSSAAAAVAEISKKYLCPIRDNAFNDGLLLIQHQEGRVHHLNKANLNEPQSNFSAQEPIPHQHGGAGIGAATPEPKASGKKASPAEEFAQFHRSITPFNGWVQSMPMSKAVTTAQQHANFQRKNPTLILQQRSNPNKEPSYRCLSCESEPLVGPIHRALAHTNTTEHKKRITSSVGAGAPAASAAAPMAEPKFPLTTDADAAILLQKYLSEISPSAKRFLESFSEYGQLQIVKEVDLWNRQTPIGKEENSYDLSAHIKHVCELKIINRVDQEAKSLLESLSPGLPIPHTDLEEFIKKYTKTVFKATREDLG